MRSLRKKGERKSGGQKGHEGTTLKQTDKPHRVVRHAVKRCGVCETDLVSEPVLGIQKRQVFDIPPIEIQVTEHQVERKVCPCCAEVTTAEFPAEVKAPVQYGPQVKAVAAYVKDYQLVPSARTCEMMGDLFGCAMSEGTLCGIVTELSEILKEPVAQIAQALTESEVVHFDETGCSVLGKLNWLHVSSSAKLTHYQVHEKRGHEATEAIGILPLFFGWAIHDHWKPYFIYLCKHGLCNAHHLRELTFVHEQLAQEWALSMKKHLVNIYRTVEQAKVEGRSALLPKPDCRF